MAKTNYTTIDEYHSAFTGEGLKRLEQIRAIVKEIEPNAEEVISYQIPAFKTGKQFLVYYCGFQNHTSLSSVWSEALLKKFEKELSSLKVSKSIIQFPHNEELPTDLITRIVTFRKQENDAKK